MRGGPPVDASHATGTDLSGAQHKQEALTAQDLAISTEEDDHRPPEPSPPLTHTAYVLPGSGCADITYIPMRRGFLYLVAILCPAGLCAA